MESGELSPVLQSLPPWPPGTSSLSPTLSLPDLPRAPKLLGPAERPRRAGLTWYPCPAMSLPLQDTVTQAASQVCDKLKILRGLCKKIMRSFLRRISWDILTGKKPQAICVDIKICKEETGECRGDIPGQPSSAHVTRFNNTKYTCQRELHKQQPEKWDVLSAYVCLAHITSFPPTLNMGKWGAAG